MKKWRLPAEWEPQAFVQLTWPHAGTDWQPCMADINATYVEMARAITRHEDLLIVSPEAADVKVMLRSLLAEEQMERIAFHQCPTNDTWARDHGFLTLMDEEGRKSLLLDFCFNGWGEKFAAEKDNAINKSLWHSGLLSRLAPRYENHLDLVLEGGSIESDGQGTIFTTACCLMAPHRNQPRSQEEIAQEMKRRLRARRIVWLDCEAMPGDDTDGHIDTMVRLAPGNTLLYNEGNKAIHQIRNLETPAGTPYRLLELPLSSPIHDEEGAALPATYANFLVINGAVLVPTYGQPDNDRQAISIIRQAFPDREMIPIDSRTIIRQHGSIHCCAMQYPQT